MRVDYSDPAYLEKRRRAFSKRTPAQGDGCREWSGGRRNSGYGGFSLFGETEYAHRAAYILFIGPIPDGLWVLHHCDNPPCVRLDHLFLGTAADNVHDRDAKGRGRFRKAGEILQAEQRDEIICRYADGEICRVIAARLGLSMSRVYAVLDAARESGLDLPSGNARPTHSKLTMATAEEIRRLHADGLSTPKLARRFGVGQATVMRVIRHKAWIVQSVA